MTYRRWTVSPNKLTDLLNNARVIGPFNWNGIPVGGKTLVFTEPGVTVTFDGEDGSNVPLAEVIAAIRKQIPDIHIDTRGTSGAPPNLSKCLSLYRDGGLGIAKDGTANALFGFGTDDETRVRPPVPDGSVKSISRIGPVEYEVIASGADVDWDDPDPVQSSKQ